LFDLFAIALLLTLVFQALLFAAAKAL